jgi:pimeloyl-ACP methyl ester carboxylesterase
MDHLDVHQAVVGGLSMGGYVALAMMRTAAERVSGLVLADTRATADSPEARAGRDRMVAVLESEGPKGVAREMIPKLLGETTRSERRDLVEAVEQLIERNGTDGIRAAILAMKARPDASDVLPTIRCPTLVICGAEDTVTPPAESEVLHKAISGSRLAIIPSAGHLSNLENPMGFMGTGLFSTDFHPPGPGLW